MGALKLRKDVSKPGLLRVVREVFEGVVEEVCGRKFSTGDCLMSGLAVFLEKHASLLQFDLTRHRYSVVEMNLRRLYGLAQVPCDTTLRGRRSPGSDLAGAVSTGVSAGTATRPARQGAAADVGVARSLSGSRGWYRHLFLPAGSRSVLSAGPASQRFEHVLPSAVVCGDGASGSAAGAAAGDRSGLQRGWLDEERLRAGCLGPASSGPGFALSAHEVDRDCRWAVLAGSPDPAASGAWTALSAGGSGGSTTPTGNCRKFLTQLSAALDRSDAPWFADPSPEGQERDRQLRVVPEAELNAANPDLKVQVLQSSERRGSGEDARRAFTWVTDLPLNPHNASELARAARSRWKIENETFNTLKNVQYLEHNFGHGTQHLSDTFAALMLLAFLIDQLLEMACPVMKQIFAKCYIRTATWERLRSSFCAVAFRNWQELYGHALGIYTAYLAYDTS